MARYRIRIELPDGQTSTIRTSRPWVADALKQYNPHVEVTVHDGQEGQHYRLESCVGIHNCSWVRVGGRRETP